MIWKYFLYFLLSNTIALVQRHLSMMLLHCCVSKLPHSRLGFFYFRHFLDKTLCILQNIYFIYSTCTVYRYVSLDNFPEPSWNHRLCRLCRLSDSDHHHLWFSLMHPAALNTPCKEVLADSAETSLPWLKSRLLHSKDKTAARPRPPTGRTRGGAPVYWHVASCSLLFGWMNV